MNIPAELLPGPFRIGIALDTLLDLFDGKGGVGEGVGKGLVVFKVHVADKLVSQSFPPVQCGEEFFRYIFTHAIFLKKAIPETYPATVHDCQGQVVGHFQTCEPMHDRNGDSSLRSE